MHEGHIKNKDVRDNFKARKQSLYYSGICNNLTIKFIAILARFYRNITGYILNNPYAVLTWMFFMQRGLIINRSHVLVSLQTFALLLKEEKRDFDVDADNYYKCNVNLSSINFQC